MEILLLVQTGLYFLIAVFGLFIIIPVAVTWNNFNDLCILYAEAKWQTGGTFLFRPGPESVCEFNIYLHVGIAIMFALFVGGIHVFLIIKEKKNEQLEVPKIVRITLIVANGICAFLTLVSAGTLSAGLSEWCSQMMEGKNYGTGIETCSDAQLFKFSHGIDGSSFHTCISFALVSAWLVLIVWLTQVLLGLLRFFRG